MKISKSFKVVALMFLSFLSIMLVYFLMTPCEKKLPSALIIGVPKCGTEALSEFLSFHPDISIVSYKEFRFFSDYYERGFDWYRNELPCSRPNQLVIERSSNYYRGDKVPERVRRMNSTIKLILVVCEPVRRAISQFAMRVERHKLPNKTFEQLIFQDKNGVRQLRTNWYIPENSKYSHYFSRWLDVFPFEQLFIVDGDNLKSKPWQEVSATERFLGIKSYFQQTDFVFNRTKGFFCFNGGYGMSCLVPSKGRKHPVVDETVKKALSNFFKPYNELFYKQSNRRFNW